MLTLYLDPVSTTSRPIALFAADAGIALNLVPINLMLGEHASPAFADINPNQAVPVLDHDGFRLTESASILKYLAELTQSPAYPQELQARARVNEWIDWFNTFLARDYCYGLIYPKLFEQLRFSEAAERERAAFCAPRAAKRFKVLDAKLASPGPWLTGETITIADYFGACFVTIGELIDFDLSHFPNVQRWVADMKQRSAWDEVHAGFYGWQRALRQCREAQRAAS